MALASVPALTIGGAPRVNLLPRAVIERRESAGLVRRWSRGLVAALAVVIIAGASAFFLQATAQQRLDEANATTNDLVIQVATLQPVNDKLKLQTDLAAFRSQAMGTDLSWAQLLEKVKATLPSGVGVFKYSLSPGGLPKTDALEAEIGAEGDITFTSETAADIVALIRSIRAIPGVLEADGVASRLEDSEYQYELRVSFDQTVYSGEYSAEADQ